MEAQAIRRPRASLRSRRPVHGDLVRQAPRRGRHRSFDGKDRNRSGQRDGRELYRHPEDRTPRASTAFPRPRSSEECHLRVPGRVLQPAPTAFGLELPEPRRPRGGYNGRSGSGLDATRPRDRGNSTGCVSLLVRQSRQEFCTLAFDKSWRNQLSTSLLTDSLGVNPLRCSVSETGWPTTRYSLRNCCWVSELANCSTTTQNCGTSARQARY